LFPKLYKINRLGRSILSKKTKYSIKALLYLAARAGEGPVLVSEIARREGIPQKFLENILLELRNQGILQSRRGRGGGYYLIKEPKDVTLAEVYRLFDGPIALLPCATYKYYERCLECKDEKTCGIRSVIQEIRDQTVSILKKSSLAEVMRRERKLKETQNRNPGHGTASRPSRKTGV
jgi:Rrf2 family protein